MPDRALVQAFIALVERGAYVEAMERFYAEDATMRENQQPPRTGLATLIEGERAFLARIASIRALPVERWLVDGDQVVINWVFEITAKDGGVKRMDELAIQTWRDGKIVREQFYYDPVSIV
jgi:ketosteroid isomerase-like protein